jgi:DNA-binding transcriptional ArsR family regulator
VAGIELGSFARAADKVGRSTSAVSAQLKKLEEQAGVPLFRKDGRGLALTQAGEVLLGHARRLLELNDEAAVALRGVNWKAGSGWPAGGFRRSAAARRAGALCARPSEGAHRGARRATRPDGTFRPWTS